MKPLKLGTKVRTHVHHAEMRKGDRGTVASVHTGVFYGVANANGGGISYMPAFHADPPGEPDGDADDSGNGMVDTDDAPGTGGAGSSGGGATGGGAGGSSSGGSASGS